MLHATQYLEGDSTKSVFAAVITTFTINQNLCHVNDGNLREGRKYPLSSPRFHTESRSGVQYFARNVARVSTLTPNHLSLPIFLPRNMAK